MRRINYFHKNIYIYLHLTALMMPDKPYPKVPKKMAGSMDIKDSALRANEVLTGVGSSAISSEDGVGGSLSMMISCRKKLSKHLCTK